MEFKNIKINEVVKSELDAIANPGESYNNTIQRLINENQELKQDKKDLIEIAKGNNANQDLNQLTNNLNDYFKLDDNAGVIYTIIHKISTDLMLIDSDKITLLCNNDCLKDQAKKDKDLILKAIDINIGFIKLQSPKFDNQIDVLMQVKNYYLDL